MTDLAAATANTTMAKRRVGAVILRFVPAPPAEPFTRALDLATLSPSESVAFEHLASGCADLGPAAADTTVLGTMFELQVPAQPILRFSAAQADASAQLTGLLRFVLAHAV